MSRFGAVGDAVGAGVGAVVKTGKKLGEITASGVSKGVTDARAMPGASKVFNDLPELPKVQQDPTVAPTRVPTATATKPFKADDRFQYREDTGMEISPDDSSIMKGMKMAAQTIDQFTMHWSLQRFHASTETDAGMMRAGIARQIIEGFSKTFGMKDGKALNASMEGTIHSWKVGKIIPMTEMAQVAFKKIQNLELKAGREFQRKTFDKRVAKALHFGIQDGTAEVDEVVENMKKYFQEVDEYSKFAGMKTGTFKEYFPQIWDADKLADDNNYALLRNVFERNLMRNDPSISPRAATAQAERTIKEIMGDPTSDAAVGVEGMRVGFDRVKERKINLSPDEYDAVLAQDLLVTDHRLMDTYNREMVGLIRFHETLGGYKGLQDLIEQTRSFYEADIVNATNPATRMKLQTELRLLEKDMYSLVRSVITGSSKGYGSMETMMSHVARNTNNVTNMQVLGNAMVSSIADAAASFGTEVLGKKGIDQIHSIVRNIVPLSKAGNAYAHDLKLLQGALDYASSVDLSRQEYMFKDMDMLDKVSYATKIGSDAVIEASGLTSFDYTMRAFAHLKNQEIFIRAINESITKGSATLDPRLRSMLLSGGIDDKMAKRIHSNIHRFGFNDGDPGMELYHPNLMAWSDNEAKGAFLFAIRKAVMVDVPTSTRIDKPFWADTSIGKIIDQYKIYDRTLWNKVIRNLGDKSESRAVAYIGSSMALGMLSIGIKRKIAGSPLPDLKSWIYMAMTRSGLLGVLSSPLAVMDRYRMGLGTMAGVDLPKIEEANKWGPMIGPAWQTLEKHMRAAKSPSYGTIKAITPGQNLASLNALLALTRVGVDSTADAINYRP